VDLLIKLVHHAMNSFQGDLQASIRCPFDHHFDSGVLVLCKHVEDEISQFSTILWHIFALNATSQAGESDASKPFNDRCQSVVPSVAPLQPDANRANGQIEIVTDHKK